MTGQSSARRLRVLTVNIHKGHTAFRRRDMLEELRAAVRAVASDLVLLQEVRGTRDGLGSEQAEYLADTIWHDHAYARNAIVRNRGHGNAVLSRWPILRQFNHDVTQPGAEARGLLHCVLDLAGTPLHVICVHLGLREHHRRDQLASLCRVASGEVPPGVPLVVAGDFNDWRSRADAQLAPAGLREVHREAHGRHARTFPASFPLLRLDRIYVGRVHASHPLSLPRRPWHALSDHAPLAADITL